VTSMLREPPLPCGEVTVDREPQPQRREEDIADGQEWTERGGRPNHHGADRGGDRSVNVEPSDPPVQHGATGAQSGPDLRQRSQDRHACEHHVGHQQRVVQPERRGHLRATREVGRQRVGQECDDDYGEGRGKPLAVRCPQCVCHTQ
jgi:hypothetical protein